MRHYAGTKRKLPSWKSLGFFVDYVPPERRGTMPGLRESCRVGKARVLGDYDRGFGFLLDLSSWEWGYWRVSGLGVGGWLCRMAWKRDAKWGSGGGNGQQGGGRGWT